MGLLPLWQFGDGKKKKITNQNVQRSDERARIKHTNLHSGWFTVHMNTQILPWDSWFILWCLFWSRDVSKFYPLVFHLLQVICSEFKLQIFHNCIKITVQMMCIVFEYTVWFFNVSQDIFMFSVWYDAAVLFVLTFWLLTLCFVSVDGGSVTLAQPCHRTARCQSLK